jgi:hypothetical protein
MDSCPPRSSSRVTAACLVSLSLILTASLSACSSHRPTPAAGGESAPSAAPGRDDAQIIIPWHYVGSGQTRRDLPTDSVYIFSTLAEVAFCLDRPGRVTVDSVDPHIVAGSLRVEGFALVPNVGDAVILDEISELPAGPPVVDKACGHDAERVALTDLEVKVRILSAETVVADSFVLHYTSGGRRYDFTLPWTITICEAGDYRTHGCRPPG